VFVWGCNVSGWSLHVRVAVAVDGAHLWVRDSIPWVGCWRKWGGEEGDAGLFSEPGMVGCSGRWRLVVPARY